MDKMILKITGYGLLGCLIVLLVGVIIGIVSAYPVLSTIGIMMVVILFFIIRLL